MNPAGNIPPNQNVTSNVNVSSNQNAKTDANQGTIPSLDPIIISKLIRHYKRRDVQEEMILNAANREIAVKYGERGFGKRPDILNYPDDILELAKQGATSFHGSEELWKNPLSLKPEQKASEIEHLRTGWDLVLDIDCHFFEYSKIAAKLVVDALKYHGIKSISVKFSGNKGFHIGVPFEAFPEKIGGRATKLLFPEAPKRIALYIKEIIKNPLSEQIMRFENDNFSKIIERTGKQAKEITRYVKNEFGEQIPRLNAEPFLDIDTILISSRHLYRMPYSFNEKSWLISVPIDVDKIEQFKREDALPESIIVSKSRFLDRENVVRGEATKLMVQAFDFHTKEEERISERGFEKQAGEGVKRRIEITSALPQQMFPPCINNILNGLEDGRKRAVFILTNFLTSIGWEQNDIEAFILSWNKKNKEPLRENYVIGQLRYHRQKKKVLPPNCDNKMYYKDIRICTPDALCQRIKNPVNYSILKFRDQQREEGATKRQKKRRKTRNKIEE